MVIQISNNIAQHVHRTSFLHVVLLHFTKKKIQPLFMSRVTIVGHNCSSRPIFSYIFHVKTTLFLRKLMKFFSQTQNVLKVFRHNLRRITFDLSWFESWGNNGRGKFSLRVPIKAYYEMQYIINSIIYYEVCQMFFFLFINKSLAH